MPNPESSGQTEQKPISVEAIREALAKAATGPWRWSRSYELHDADGVLRKHWALHNDVSDAKGLVIDWALVLHTYAAADFGGRPLEETPNLSLVAHAPEYLTFLLERLDALQRDAERLDWFEENRPRVGLGEAGEARLFAREAFGAMLGEAPTFREAIDKARSGAVSVLSGADQ